MKLLPAIAVIASGLAGQALPAQDLPEWVLQLSRIKRQARANFERMPNYVCMEVIRRYHRLRNPQGKQDGRWNLFDTLRLEVAVIDGGEMFAQPGDRYLAPHELTKYVHEGAIGSGTFSGIVRNLFINDRARTTAWGKGKVRNRPAIWYDYEIPEALAGYVLQTPHGAATTGVRGRFWVDAGSLDLIRIEESALDVPPKLGIAESGEMIDYAMTRIGKSAVLLPQVSEMWMTELAGREMRNVIEFSGCREYVSESTIHFEKPVSPPAPAAKKE